METAVLIEKIIEGYDSEETITKFIELLLFVHETFVENFSLRFFGWCKCSFWTVKWQCWWKKKFFWQPCQKVLQTIYAFTLLFYWLTNTLADDENFIN